MKKITIITVLLLSTFTTNGCSTHTKEILIGGIVGSAVGAGAGYLVVHHGNRRQYVVQNTIITSAVFGLATMGVLAWHYHELDQQKVDITSKFARDWVSQEGAKGNEPGSAVTREAPHEDFNPTRDAVGRLSLKLDRDTRWVYPTFRKRLLGPEVSQDELLSSRYAWEVVRPGFFVSKDQNPTYFNDETTSDRPTLFLPNAETPKTPPVEKRKPAAGGSRHKNFPYRVLKPSPTPAPLPEVAPEVVPPRSEGTLNLPSPQATAPALPLPPVQINPGTETPNDTSTKGLPPPPEQPR